MTRKPRAPKTRAAALSKGYSAVADLPGFVQQRLGITEAAFAQQRTQYQLGAGVDCTTAADGTLCFDSWQGGVHIVGYCQNKSCQTVVKSSSD